MKAHFHVIAAVVWTVYAVAANAQLPFFPGAEGFGGSFAGTAPAGGWFSNATIYRVTNLNDSGPGSFRNAFQENTANRIIIFDVAGTINLTSGAISIKNLANYNIAGQTAPGPVTIYGNTVQLSHSSGKQNRNVALRYLSFRKGTGDGEDALTFSGGGLGTNLILDHVSASWAEDEILSVANHNTNVTVQYAMINDALVNNHAYGSLIRPQIDANVSFHHNLYAHNASRQARFGTYNSETLTADFRNNVIYNWRDRASYAGGSSDPDREFADVNYVGNYLIAGPGTTGSTTRAFSVDKNIDVRVFQSGNYIDSDRQLNPGGVPNGSDRGWSAFGLGGLGSPLPQTLTQMATPFPMAQVATQAAPEAFTQVVDHVGNWWWQRDAIDARVINNVKTNTGPQIGAAAPNAGELAGLLAAPMLTHPAGWDSDSDGMPDSWEVKHGLNPNSPAGAPDWRLDFDSDGYVNLIEYINERGEFPAPAPLVFTGAANNRYAQITNWRTDDGMTAGSLWQPSKYDDAYIRSGVAVVDAVGQHAGALAIAPAAGDAATLQVNAGWLEATEALDVGAAGQGTLDHTGGTVRAGEVVLGGAAGASGVYNLAGSGRLRTGLLGKGATGGLFNFTGGELSADLIAFDLVNEGGVLAPGDGIGQTHIVGDLTMLSGSIRLELAGSAPTAHDALVIGGDFSAGGTLEVLLASSYQPAAGDSFRLFDFSTATGAFSLDLPTLEEDLVWDASDLLTTGWLSVASASATLSGDFNADGAVDSLDLAIWRNTFGSDPPNQSPSGDADADGDVDGADFLAWQRNLSPIFSSAHAPVPEPHVFWLAMATSLLYVVGFRRAA